MRIPAAFGLLSQGIVTLLGVSVLESSWSHKASLSVLPPYAPLGSERKKQGMKPKFLFYYLVTLCQNNSFTFLVSQKLLVFLLSELKKILCLMISSYFLKDQEKGRCDI